MMKNEQKFRLQILVTQNYWFTFKLKQEHEKLKLHLLNYVLRIITIYPDVNPSEEKWNKNEKKNMFNFNPLDLHYYYYEINE